MKDQHILDLLIQENVIPAKDAFVVDIGMIDRFSQIYYDLHGHKDTPIREKNARYCRKLAGLSLLKLNDRRSSSTVEKLVKPIQAKQKCGIVYLITNPAWPNVAKIGLTQDLDKRLNQYQTCDPYRQFKVEHSIFVTDMRRVESHFVETAQTDLAKGEWVDYKIGKALILNYKE